MKNHLSFLLFGIVLCFKSFVESKDINCEKQGNATVCKFHNVLTSVETRGYQATILDENISLIMPRAFSKTKASMLTLSFTKGPLTIEPESFEGLERMKFLDLSSDRSTITLYNDTFLYTPDLETLKMTLNEATTTLMNKFQTIQLLKHLIIIGGQLEIIKNDTFTSANNKLRYLQISSCSIFSIEPKTFANLKNLETLDLSNNSLMGIAPGTFDGLSNLQILIIKKNNIYKIKEATLNKLVNLNYFDISDNDLTEISNESFYNTKIKHLFLQNNRIKTIQKELFNYTNSTLIKHINLHNNSIDHIDEGAFARLNLDVLDLTKNKLKVITKKIFRGCSEIKNLYLSGNNISKIYENAFKDCNILRIALPSNYSENSKLGVDYWGLSSSIDIVTE